MRAAIWTLAVFLGFGAGTSGCARYQYLDVRSHPEGAEVFVDGELVGTAPLQLRVHRDDHHKVFLKKPGYRSELVVLELHETDDGIDFLTPPDIDVALTPGRDAPDEPGRDVKIELGDD